jgi:membrane associated rhomboid family serine protease
MGGPPLGIPTRSKRQAMDWSLVLASQDIAAIITRGEMGWELLIDQPDYERAKAVLSQYQVENRGWRWTHEVPGTSMDFHWGSLLWAAGMAGFYYWTMVRSPALQDLGMVKSDRIVHGQWWRLFTAVTLHENLSHLAGNVSMGFLLLGFAMARYGPGAALLAAFVAGAAGNLASVLLDPTHESLGASGMVTAALGLITVQRFAPRRTNHLGRMIFRRAIAAGVLILVLIAFGPGVDVVAHLGGFLAGAIFGLALGFIKPNTLQRGTVNLAAGLLLAALVVVTWLLAVHQ